MPITPLNNRILLRPIKKEKVTKSGIILASSEEQKMWVYNVVKTFPGAVVEPGQKVIASQFSGFDYEDKGKKYKIVDEDSLLALYE